MKRVTYMSSFSRPLAREEIDEIGSLAAGRNADDGITGVLLTLDRVFFQIIEGEAAAIDDLYARVLRDDRHTDIVCLQTESDVHSRIFPDWSMNVFDLSEIDGDIGRALKLLLRRMSDAQHIIERYTQPAVSRIMAQGLNPLHVPLRTVERVVLFTDMVAFSTITERLPIEEVSDLVSVYLEACSTGIARRGGEVSKYLGDGVMAYFDADGADDALQACVDIHRELSHIRERAGTDSARRLIHSGFGLALGPVIEGSMGSSVKMDYTIIGEPVNTAARLEALTRTVDHPLLMTREVADATRRSWAIRFVDEFDIGRDAPVSVHSLEMGAPESTGMRAAVTDHLEPVTAPED